MEFSSYVKDDHFLVSGIYLIWFCITIFSTFIILYGKNGFAVGGGVQEIPVCGQQGEGPGGSHQVPSRMLPLPSAPAAQTCPPTCGPLLGGSPCIPTFSASVSPGEICYWPCALGVRHSLQTSHMGVFNFQASSSPAETSPPGISRAPPPWPAPPPLRTFLLSRPIPLPLTHSTLSHKPASSL